MNRRKGNGKESDGKGAQDDTQRKVRLNASSCTVCQDAKPLAAQHEPAMPTLSSLITLDDNGKA
jgi:hypothetical protein